MTAAQGAGLSDEEREALAEGLFDWTGLSLAGAFDVADHLAPTIEVIKRAAIAAALTAAAEAIEGMELARKARRGDIARPPYTAYAMRNRAAAVVRDLIPQEES